MQLEPINFRDGESVKVSVFEASNPTDYTMLFLPAMGVRASFYKDFAAALAEKGVHVITADYRGHGHSSVRASRKNDFGYEALIEDVFEMVQFIQQRFPKTKLILSGHSLGGQINTLFAAKYPTFAQRLLLIAACSVYYKGWEGRQQTQVRLAVTLFPIISQIFGYFPGNKLGFGGRESRTVIRDWTINGKTGKYQLLGSSFNYEENLKQLELPTLAVSLNGDWMASKKAVKNLYHKLSNQSAITHLHLSGEDLNIDQVNHFNWAKKPERMVRHIKDWM